MSFVVREGAVDSSRYAMIQCDNDDRYLVAYRSHVLSMSVFLAVVVSLVVRESAVVWSRSVIDAVTMMTRHPIALRAHMS